MTLHLGTGIAFPLALDHHGAVALARDEEDVDQAIRIILGTAPGERPMRPEFGCAIHDLVFAPVNDRTIGRIRYEVHTCLDRWEPRIEVESVDVTVDSADTSVLYIDVRYSVRGTNNPRSLVFPFYVIPSHESPDEQDRTG